MLFCAIFNAPAQAQVLVSSGIDPTKTHGWAVYENSLDEIVLVHLPPRDGDPDARIPIAPAIAGELRVMRGLGSFPDAIAAVENWVYLVFPPVTVDDRQLRRVYSGRAVASPMGSVWGFEPRGRLNSEPAIQIAGEIVDFVPAGTTLCVLLSLDKQYTLLTLEGSSWEGLPLPDIDGARWRLSASGDQLVAVDVSDHSSLDAYIHSSKQRGLWSQGWESAPLAQNEFELIAGINGVFITDRDEHGLVRIRTWSAAGVYQIASGLELPADTQLTMLGSVNRLVGVFDRSSLTLEADWASEPQATVEVYEIDLADGSMIYSGDPTAVVPVTAAEMRFLMGMMVLIMVGVLVVVILPDKADAMGIPDGFALADPGRRLMATMFDVFVVSFLIGMIFDVRVVEIVTLSVIARSDTSWLVVPMVMVSGIGVMSVLEWLFGATPGKWMMGLRVVRGQSGAMERVPLWAAVVRNMIKWLVPPVAALALVDPELLHRGDRITKTLVATPIIDNGINGDPDDEH